MVDNNRTENPQSPENTQAPYATLSEFVVSHCANRPITVFPVDGPVGSRKTKVVQRLIAELNKQGVSPLIIETDWFLKSRQDRHGLSPENYSDLRNWFSVGELKEFLTKILKGRKELTSEKLYPFYSHATGDRTADYGVLEIDPAKKPVIIMEGFVSASPVILDYLKQEEALGGVIWVTAPEDVCLERQVKRIEDERNYRGVQKQTELHQNIFTPSTQKHQQSIKGNIDLVVDNTQPNIEQIEVSKIKTTL